jgi:hypothetical protein
VLESIPVVGSHLMLWIFGGDVPGHRIIPRLYWLHMLLPVAMAGLLVLRRWLVRRRGHTRFPGPAGSRRPGSLRNVPAAAGVAMFFITCGVLALAGALAQISPIWLYGPYQPGSMSAGAAPDWYMGFLDGALRIMPGWELNVAGHPLTLAVLVPGLIVPGAFFTLLASYPLLESRLTGDLGVHHFLDRPRDAATRTAVGTAGITFYGLLWAASSNDQIAAHIGLDLYAVTWFFRLAVLAGPLLAYILTQRICLGLTRREEEETKHGRETGRIVLSPDGGFSEITEPVRPVREDSPGSNLPPAGQGVPVGRGHPDLDRRAALGRWPAGEIRRAVAPRASAHRPLPGPGAAGGAGRLGAAPGGGRRTTCVAYTALGWVVLFFAFHVYWYLGGSFGSPGKLPGGPHSLVAWIVDVLVAVAFPLGAFVCLAIARGWARGRLALAAAALVWSGCVLLLLRGGAGVLDDLSRAAGLLPNGITGLSLTETAGAANASAYVVWSGRAIDAYFLAGGIIFWFLAVHYGAQQAHSRRRTSCGRAADPRPGPRWPAAVLPGRHHPGHGRTHLGPETVRGRPETSRET